MNEPIYRLGIAMRAERLLERIHDAGLGIQPLGSEVTRLIASVARYLSLMLNTQQGSAQTVPDFGMPDFNQIRFGNGLDNLRGLERVIADRVLKYEPRVQRLRVEFMPQQADPLSLMFRISLTLASHQKLIPVVFETVLDSDGHISIQDS